MTSDVRSEENAPVDIQKIKPIQDHTGNHNLICRIGVTCQ